MISNITLSAGRSPNSGAIEIELSPVTVFVGPNNSGKSLILQELNEAFQQGVNPLHKLVSDFSYQAFEQESIQDTIDRIGISISDNGLNECVVAIGRMNNTKILRSNLAEILGNPKLNPLLFRSIFIQGKTLNLGGVDRINLINEQVAGDLQSPPGQSLQVLFRDAEKRENIRRIIYEAFKLYFTIDPTNLGMLRIKLSKKPPTEPLEEIGIHPEAVRFHSESTPITDFSDGVKAFTGILTSVFAGDPDILIVDEPEAFLHPGLALKLGLEISRAALQTNKRIFVSTHSPNFVLGCIQSGAPVNIVRLTYSGEVSTARNLASDDVLKLMRNPLLRSNGLISGLFYENVVVTEADSDRVFYQEINERLLKTNPKWGIPNCLFINAQNKQTIRMMIEPLRKLGIPAAAIVDIDVIKEGGKVWSSFMDSLTVPEITKASLSSSRTAIVRALQKTGKDMKKDGGLSLLGGQERLAAQDLFRQLAEYGAFVVPGGELESWLKKLGVPGHGTPWLIKVFEEIGEDPSSPNYLLPSEDDVWKFILEVKSWLSNQTRRGIPE